MGIAYAEIQSSQLRMKVVSVGRSSMVTNLTNRAGIKQRKRLFIVYGFRLFPVISFCQAKSPKVRVVFATQNENLTKQKAAQAAGITVVPAGERALKNHPVDDFSERFFAQRKANPANKKSRASGYYYVVPAGLFL